MSTFKLPDLGEGLAEAEIIEWHVQPGDHVRVDQRMVSVETAKAVVDVPVPFDGTVTALHGAVGDIVATGAPLIDFDSGTVVGSMPATSADELIESVTLGTGRGNGRSNGQGNGRANGHGTHGPLSSNAAAASRTRAMPVARALARQLGLDLDSVAGGGTDGIIRLDDVMRHANIRSAGPDVVVPQSAVAEPLRGARRAMAHSMSMSRDQVAGSTVCDDADIHAWAPGGDYMLRLIRALVSAAAVEPALNAWYDPANNARVLMKHIDLAIAVDTAGGLIVPVLRNIHDATSDALRAAITAHKEAAHRRSTAPEDLRDFTMMLSNFGTLAGRYGIPLVVPPAVAILGAGKVRKDAVVVDDVVVAHRRMPLSLSFDHRCVTGGEACRFLAAVIADLEKTN
jgi:2-oxoisovalerate dehydrogenase E2 component (dihydrolipoyl transacylase)